MENLKNNNLVSIVTPTFNSKYINETIKSILNQTYLNWELLITDDCSTDGKTWKIINEYAIKDSRIKIFRLNKNSGSGLARNMSIKNACGKYIAFLDSDDIWKANKLARQVSFMQDNDAAFSHTSYGFINALGENIKKTFTVGNEPVTYNKLLKRIEIGCLTAMFDVEKIGKMYMPDIRRKQDYGLWLSILKRGYVSLPLNEELSFYRVTKGQATGNKFKLIFKHYVFLKRTERLNFFNSVYYTFLWGYNGFLKHYLSKLY